MKIAYRDRRDAAKVRYGQGDGAVLQASDANAELSVAVVAPALHASAREERARLEHSGGNRHQTVPGSSPMSHGGVGVPAVHVAGLA